jgi:hypothetical protein
LVGDKGELEWIFWGVGYDIVKREDGDITDRSDYDKKFENIRMRKRKRGKQLWEFHHLTKKHLDNTNLVKEGDRR